MSLNNEIAAEPVDSQYDVHQYQLQQCRDPLSLRGNSQHILGNQDSTIEAIHALHDTNSSQDAPLSLNKISSLDNEINIDLQSSIDKIRKESPSNISRDNGHKTNIKKNLLKLKTGPTAFINKS